MINRKTLLVAATLAGTGFLAGCVETQAHLAPNFGVAERQDMAAQIANPDAKYLGKPDPGSNGSRAALAQSRYVRDRVIQPVISPSTTVITQGGGQGGGAPADSGGGGGGPQ